MYANSYLHSGEKQPVRSLHFTGKAPPPSLGMGRGMLRGITAQPSPPRQQLSPAVGRGVRVWQEAQKPVGKSSGAHSVPGVGRGFGLASGLIHMAVFFKQISFELQFMSAQAESINCIDLMFPLYDKA